MEVRVLDTLATTTTHRNRMVAVPTTTTGAQTVVIKEPGVVVRMEVRVRAAVARLRLLHHVVLNSK